MKKFKNYKETTNIYVIKCYKLLFSYKFNIGSHIIFFIILIHLISIVIFTIKRYEVLINKINNIINSFEIKQNRKKIDDIKQSKFGKSKNIYSKKEKESSIKIKFSKKKKKARNLKKIWIYLIHQILKLI